MAEAVEEVEVEVEVEAAPVVGFPYLTAFARHGRRCRR